MMDQDTVSTRAVCFMDILGFKNMVETIQLRELSLKYEGLLMMAASHIRPLAVFKDLPSLFPEHLAIDPYCDSYVFSDSLIFIANDSSALSCLKLLVFSWRIMQAFLARRIPVRGGVTCNEIYVNPHTRICLGRGLTQAYELEQKQNWVGVAIDASR